MLNKVICLFAVLLLYNTNFLYAQYFVKQDSVFNKKNADSVFNKTFLLPKNYYSNNLRFICKKELQLQKAIKLPLYIRLGSLDYTNKLEGKKY